MASIRKRENADGTVIYQVQIRLKGHPQQAASFDRLTDARVWAASVESAIREGRHFKNSESKKHTVSDLIKRYIKQIVPTKKDGKSYKRHLEWWDKKIGPYLLSDVTSALIVETRDELRQGGISDSTVNRYMASISHMFSLAFREWEWIPANPCIKIRKLKEPRGRTRFLSEDERIRLHKCCKESKSDDLYHAVLLALATGARKGELLGLKWNQVNFERRVITLHETKNNEVRVLPLSGIAIKVLEERLFKRKLEKDLIFPSPKRPNRPVDIHESFELACKKAEISNFHWHDLRHTTASYLAMNGASLAEIAEVLGHKTLAMVKRYAHLGEAHTANVVESMNKKMFEGVG